MMQDTKLYNATPLSYTPFDTYTLDFPETNYKYADINFVYKNSINLVRQVIDAAPISGRYKRVLVDVKTQNLTPKVCSCIPGWHLDGSQVEEELFHLIVFNGPCTEFLAEPTLLTTISPSADAISIKNDAIVSYNSNHFHRGVYAKQETRRVLIRLTETNIITARNAPFIPYSERKS